MKWLVVLSLLLASGCSGARGHWTWVHPDSPSDENSRKRGIFECETYVRDNQWKGPHQASSGSRDYGGWGNAEFESCMRDRGWRWEFVQARGADQ